MDYKPACTQRPSSGPRRRSTAQTALSTPSPAPKSSWFGRKSLGPTPTPTPPPPQRSHDDLLTLNLHTSLFPTGPADPLSPHAFNDLLLNATSLLQRLQAAYREKVEFIAAVLPEIEAQREEVEEAETRAEHLRLQLEAMGRVVGEGEEVVREKGARESVRMVRRSVGGGEEDEETPRRRKRGSAGSASDSGFESDAEYAESITSAGGGVETPLSPAPLMTLTPAYDGREWAPSRPGLSRQSTMSGYSAMAYNGGKDLAAAEWTSAEVLRGENARLRRQVEDMQRSLQGCIDFVGGVKA
ncbi:hypothetical protein B0A54_02934 [Friedmanniomyces endolithicus]|nr:hypothetical protein B0A54_02934 [Friedmanniomyces endolithicus]